MGSRLANFGTKIKKWQPGQSGNPKGRPPKLISITSYLKEHLAEVDEATGKNYAELVALKLIELAIGGDLEAIREILNRVDGKVIEKHEIDGQIPVTLIFSPAPTSINEVQPLTGTEVETSKIPILLSENANN
jgi:hypothetical protein